MELTIAAVTAAQGVVAVGVLQALVFAVGLSIVESSGAAPGRTTPCSAGSSGWAGTATSRCTATPASRPGSSCTAWTTGSSSPTRATSRAACSRRCGGRSNPGTLAPSSTPGPATHVDATGLAALADLRDALRRENIDLVFARAKTRLLERLGEGGFADDGGVTFHPTARAAVAARTET